MKFNMDIYSHLFSLPYDLRQTKYLHTELGVRRTSQKPKEREQEQKKRSPETPEQSAVEKIEGK
jgi:hypothetical protein